MKSPVNKITLEELRGIFEKAITEYEEMSGNDFLEIDRDLYWVICHDQLYNPNQQPSDFTLGDLVEEVEELKSWLRCGENIGTVGIDRLSAVLKFMAAVTLR